MSAIAARSSAVRHESGGGAGRPFDEQAARRRARPAAEPRGRSRQAPPAPAGSSPAPSTPGSSRAGDGRAWRPTRRRARSCPSRAAPTRRPGRRSTCSIVEPWPAADDASLGAEPDRGGDGAGDRVAVVERRRGRRPQPRHPVAVSPAARATLVLPAPPVPTSVSSRLRCRSASRSASRSVAPDQRRQSGRQRERCAGATDDAGRSPCGGTQCVVVVENLLFEPAQLRSGFEAELARRGFDGLAGRRAGRRPSPALPVPGGHQQRPPVLVERFAGDEFLQRRLRLGEPAGRQFGLQPGGSGTRDERGEPRRRRSAVLAVGDVVEWLRRGPVAGLPMRAAASVAVSILLGGLPARPSEPFELDDVHPVVGAGHEGVAAPLGDDLGPGESAAKLGHLRLQGVGGRTSRRATAVHSARSPGRCPGAAAIRAVSNRRCCAPRGVTSAPSSATTVTGPSTLKRTTSEATDRLVGAAAARTGVTPRCRRSASRCHRPGRAVRRRRAHGAATHDPRRGRRGRH